MAGEPSLELLEDWEEWNPDSGTPFYVHAVAGSIAGAAEHCAMFPFDTVKTFAQAESNATGIGRNLKNLVQAEGALRLWRGVTTMLTGCIPAHAAYFSIYEHGKVYFKLDDPNAAHNPIAAATCGALATIAHDSVMTPMDVLKQRMQLGFGSSIRSCFMTVVNTDGVGALFRSFPTTLLMNIPYAGIMVATNESAKKILNPQNEYNVGAFFLSGGISGAIAAACTNPLDVVKTRLQTQTLLSHKQPSAGTSAGTNVPSGKNNSIFRYVSSKGVLQSREVPLGVSPNHFAANMALCRHKYSGNDFSKKGTTTFTNNAGIQKRPHLTSPNSVQIVRYNGMLDAMKTIYLEEGLRGFTRGLKPRLMVNAPSVAISWTAYETAKSCLLSA
mmetsp:Transcript_6778/g.7792  ORF Transcript_6778/g.7792 Transcript_6778/m.7792 type:complete len:386 (+) Transcript_6778:442-1599(+)